MWEKKSKQKKTNEKKKNPITAARAVLDCDRYLSNPIITWADGIQTFVASIDTWSIIDQLLIN